MERRTPTTHPGNFTLSTNAQLAKRPYDVSHNQFACWHDHDLQDWQSQADQPAHSLKSRASTATSRENGLRNRMRFDQDPIDALTVHVDDFEREAVPIDPITD